LSLWLRRRGVPFAAVWTREKLSGGQAEVEHSHLLFHLPDSWLNGAKLVSVTGGVEGGVELLQLGGRAISFLGHTTGARMMASISSRVGANKRGNFFRASKRIGANLKA